MIKKQEAFPTPLNCPPGGQTMGGRNAKYIWRNFANSILVYELSV
jgi:hypothetical protein